MESISATDKNKVKLGYFMVILCGMTWGLGGVLGQKLFANSDITPAFMSSTRMIISGIIILAVCVVREGKQTFKIYTAAKDIPLFLFFALFGVMAMQFSYFASVEASNAATATVLQYIYPALILMIETVRERRVPKFYEGVCVISAFMGVFTIATHFHVSNLHLTPMALVWGMLSAVSYAIYTIVPDRLYTEYGLAKIIGNSLLVGGIVLFISTRSYRLDVTLNAFVIGIMIYIILFSSLMPLLLYGKGVRILGSVKASLLVTVEPVFCAVVSIILKMTVFTWVDFLGFLFILAPIEYTALRDRK